ncbi:MAG TPA: hypothetical protein VNN76_08505 [Bacteroidota bacterium]|nr:hypothetical protein [Bacteroidota bacterium]
MSISLGDIRRRAEQFFQELEKEYYLEGAGLKDEVNAAAIYEKYADLSSRSLVEYLQRELQRASSSSGGAPDPEHQRKLRLLLETTVQTFLGNSVRKQSDLLLTTEANGMISLDGESEAIGFRAAAVHIMNEGNRRRRGGLSSARDRFTQETLNPIYRQIFETLWEETGRLGYRSYAEMVQHLSGIDLLKLRTMTEEFLNETEDLYVETLGWFVKKELGIPLSDLKKHDLAYLSRAKSFDEHFPGSVLVETVLGFIRKMSIDPAAGGAIHLDVEPRPKKSPRAFCSTVRIPDEIYLVIMPAGGADDYEAFLHELGHALHFGFTSPRLDWEYKRLGDYSVTEGYAIGFDHLMQDSVWLKKVIGLQKPHEFLRHSKLMELMMLRRYSAKLAYELILHDGTPLHGKSETYRDLLTSATRAEYSTAHYLSDVDPFFYCARYLRAWMLQSMLHEYLRENFNEDWFVNPKTGEFLKELWNQGQKHTAEEIARQLAYPALTMDLLKESIEGVLAH